MKEIIKKILAFPVGLIDRWWDLNQYKKRTGSISYMCPIFEGDICEKDYMKLKNKTIEYDNENRWVNGVFLWMVFIFALLMLNSVGNWIINIGEEPERILGVKEYEKGWEFHGIIISDQGKINFIGKNLNIGERENISSHIKKICTNKNVRLVEYDQQNNGYTAYIKGSNNEIEQILKKLESKYGYTPKT